MTKRPLYFFTGAALACLAALAGLTMNRWPGEEPQRVSLSGAESAPPERKAELNAPAAPEKIAEPAEKLEKPEFDTVRIEANGEAIVAGRAKPGADVALTIDGKIIGKGKANAEGAWVVVPDAPLPKGTSEIVAEQNSGDSQGTVASDQTIAVAIAEGGTSQPLIAITEPGEATKVVQKPDAKTAGTVMAEKAPEPVVEKAPEPAASEKVGDAVVAEKAPEPVVEKAPEPAASEKADDTILAEKAPEPVVEKAPEPAASEKVGDAVVAEKAPEPVVEKAPEPAASEKADDTVVAEKALEPVVEKAPEPGASEKTDDIIVAEKASEPVVEKAPEPVAGETKSDPSTDQVIASAPPQEDEKLIPLALDVVDYNEKGEIVFSGRAEPGTAVRLYVDNGALGDAIVASSGQWSFAGNETIVPGTHKLRADQIDAAGKVLSRIELPFQREAPEAVAALNQPAEPEPKPEPELKVPDPEEVASMQPAEEKSAADDAPIEQKIEAEPAEEKVAPEVSASVDVQGGVVTEAAAKPRAGRVVIQPGNNLWKLSRVIYGRGVNYSVIYAANQEQIRNPDLIYPGQIFAIPNAEPPETIDPKRRKPLTSAEGGTALE